MSFRLVKGPNGTISADPVDPKAPRQAFPLVAKFPASVVIPHFDKPPWSNGRLYQQDVPKPLEDSDEEEGGDSNNTAKNPKKRWRGTRRPEAAQRQWILQEQVDFLETMVARREKRSIPPDKLSSRYEGLPESNFSHFALLMLPKQTPPPVLDRGDGDDDSHGDALQVRIVAPGATVAFAQPAARKTLSLSEAEQVLEDRRMGIRTMHHKLGESDQPATAAAVGGGAPAAQGTALPLLRRRIAPSNKNSSKSRLLDKLQRKAKAEDDGVEDADDVMADVTFRHRKGNAGGGGGRGAGSGGAADGASSGAARKELLQALGDGVTVSEEGVLGGTNDALFGGRQRFAAFRADTVSSTSKASKGGADGADGPAERGADGAAMADDFYQRDVQAEYEELDYDANEQFDDDDVDVGEKETAVDEGYEQDDDDEDDDDIEPEEAVSGAEGLASVAGFKLMLAKARGEAPAGPVGAAGDGSESSNGDKKADDAAHARPEEEKDHMSKIMAAAEKARAEMERAANPQLPKKADASAIQVDENGLRIITLEAVRNEIWLNHGSIALKRLVKIFDIKKKFGAERQDKFRVLIKELCTMKTDPVLGTVLVLKQHYANM